jgi:spore germination cell wall hydrolase CwlJ-like protein
MDLALTLSRPARGLRLRAAQLSRGAEALWRAYPRETLGVGLLGIAMAVAIVGSSQSKTELPATPPPAPPPLLLKQVAPEQALKINSAIPVAAGPNPAALPFVFKGNAATRAQALECLTSAVYYEAGSQDDNGERAVAQVVLNRVRHSAFPASVCAVVYEGSTRATGCQFTFTCDGSLYRRPDLAGWRRAYRIAEQALNGYVYAPVGWATHYHADYVVPYWASTLAKNAVVGAHIFYRWAGGWGQPAAFTKSYSGHEPSAVALRNAALAAEAVVGNGSQSSEIAKAVADIPGAQPLAPSMRGDKRVAIRFNLAARKASDDAPHEDYVKKFGASDNLKWSLSSDIVASDEKPLGRAKPSAAAPSAQVATGGAESAAAVAATAKP